MSIKETAALLDLSARFHGGFKFGLYET